MYICTYVRMCVRTHCMSHNAVALLPTRLAMPSKCTENSNHLMGRMPNWARYGWMYVHTYKRKYVRMCVCTNVSGYCRKNKIYETDRYKERRGGDQITVQGEGGVVQVYVCMFVRTLDMEIGDSSQGHGSFPRPYT